MRAAVIWEAGGPFTVHDGVERRAPGDHDVVLRIHAAGICQTDISLSRGAFGQAMPVVLGHEGAGEVIEIGAQVSGWRPGDRALLTWVPSCGRCYHCLRGETYICAARKRAGDLGGEDLRADGRPVMAGMGTATFASEAVVPESALIPIPPDLPYEEAALLGCGVPTGLGAALNSARIRPGDTAVVTGCGLVGLSAVQGSRIAGASRIVAVDPQESRRDRAVALGATHAFAPGDTAISAVLDGPGFDVGIDAVGTSTTIRATWGLVRRGGTLVVVGAGQPDDQVVFSATELFHDEKTLRGSFYGSCNMRFEVPRMVGLWRSGQLRLSELIDDVVDLGEINDAVGRQLSGDVLRVVLSA